MWISSATARYFFNIMGPRKALPLDVLNEREDTWEALHKTICTRLQNYHGFYMLIERGLVHDVRNDMWREYSLSWNGEYHPNGEPILSFEYEEDLHRFLDISKTMSAFEIPSPICVPQLIVKDEVPFYLSTDTDSIETLSDIDCFTPDFDEMELPCPNAPPSSQHPFPL